MRNKKTVQVVAILAIVAFVAFLIFSNLPKDKPAKPDPRPVKEKVVPPAFNADSAYAFIQKQVDFGPRVPNSESAQQCGDWLISKLESYGAKVQTQEAVVTAYNGTRLNMRNIIAEFQPEKKKRLMLYAHWDTRPWADKDTVRIKEPIDGANDGGSGVAVLLEIARSLQNKPTDYGIDIILFDTEDYGVPEFDVLSSNTSENWCLGSQYWGKKPHKPNYRAKYGILLDMVGGKNAKFPIEGFGDYYAGSVIQRVWGAAERKGYSDLFLRRKTGGITDDHYFVNEFRQIPSIDIIEYHINTMGLSNSFGSYHHTHADNMDNISTETLNAVGSVMLDVIYNE